MGGGGGVGDCSEARREPWSEDSTVEAAGQCECRTVCFSVSHVMPGFCYLSPSLKYHGGLVRSSQARKPRASPNTPRAPRTPTVELGWQFVRERVLAGHHDDVVELTWSADSNFFASCSKDRESQLLSPEPRMGGGGGRLRGPALRGRKTPPSPPEVDQISGLGFIGFRVYRV